MSNSASVSDCDVLIRPNENEEDEEESAKCCDPRSTMYRFLALFLMCFIGFGYCFCYDIPGALQDNFKSDMDLTTSEFVLLYSWYSWPTVILCFVGGFLLDRVFGLRWGTIIYSAVLVLGQFIFALGGLVNIFWVMILGRFIFGIGSESLAVAQNNYAYMWFKGKELNMVFGLQLSFARVGSTVNFQVMEPFYNWVNKYYQGYMCIGMTLLIAGLTCVLSLICAIILAWMDKRNEKFSKPKSTQETELIKITDVKDFPGSFWMISVVCISYYSAVLPFIALGKVFFERKFDFQPNEANQVNSIVYIISAFLSPLMGFIVDKTGKNVFWVFLAILGAIGSHGLLAFTFVNPYVGMIILGLSYSMLASALWPMVALVIPEYQLGTAYGITQSIQNLGLALITMVAGLIVDSGGYLMLEVFFLACLCVSLIAIVVIWIFDSLRNGILNMSVKERDLYESNKLGSEILEREKLLASGSMADVTPQDLLSPQSDFYIRNRYLSRIGARVIN
ncbi:transport protein, putative [Pediculus humanus corporis]|uniref:Lysosomal dipeptide transporter MFSD1 n=1 Tax=Pediculus humanus subsp. corporis TaxID=121224 RepID=E0VY61_PEDHC|nr:transport protein, putative [Pediculus humanus corporis]EEB18317.1 transport protein, putative [Pediculus humanus corporis]